MNQQHRRSHWSTVPMPVTDVGGASRTLPTGLFNEGQSNEEQTGPIFGFLSQAQWQELH